MKITPLPLPGLLLIEPELFHDRRGFFYEHFNQRRFLEQTGIDAGFVQDNLSRSSKNVVRGLHYQIRQPQGKLVAVIAGEIFDVAVDLRRSSATFGQWFSVLLSAENRQQLWIPPGFAHGFAVTSESADVLYKTTDYWAPEHDRCLLWNDPAVGIRWPIGGAPVLSDRDQEGLLLSSVDTFD